MRLAIAQSDGDDWRCEGDFPRPECGPQDAHLPVFHFDFESARRLGQLELGVARRIVFQLNFNDSNGGAAGIFAGVQAHARVPADFAGPEGNVPGNAGFFVVDAQRSAVEMNHHAVNQVDVGAAQLSWKIGGAHNADPLVLDDEWVLGQTRE